MSVAVDGLLVVLLALATASLLYAVSKFFPRTQPAPDRRTQRSSIVARAVAIRHAANTSAHATKLVLPRPKPHVQRNRTAKVAVCAAGAVNTFAHPRIVRGFALLMQPSWDLYAVLGRNNVTLRRSERPRVNYMQLMELNSDESVLAALRALHVKDYIFFKQSDVPRANCSVHGGAEGSMQGERTAMLFSVQQCLHVTARTKTHPSRPVYSFIVRVRPDHLFTKPLPPVSIWAADALHTSYAGEKSFAIVPSRFKKTYFSVFDLVQKGCRLLRNTSVTQHFPEKYQCWRDTFGELNRPFSWLDCAFRVRLHYQALRVSTRFADGLPVKAPSVAAACVNPQMPLARSVCL